MSTKITIALANHQLAGGSFKDAMDGGRLFLFAGPVPATAAEALSIGSTHELVAEITESDDGMTGLTWDDTPSGGVISKAGDESWAGTAAATATMTFFRFCESGDDGEGSAGTSLKRFQGTIGPDGSFDMIRANPSVSASDTITIDVASYTQPLG